MGRQRRGRRRRARCRVGAVGSTRRSGVKSASTPAGRWCRRSGGRHADGGRRRREDGVVERLAHALPQRRRVRGVDAPDRPRRARASPGRRRLVLLGPAGVVTAPRSALASSRAALFLAPLGRMPTGGGTASSGAARVGRSSSRHDGAPRPPPSVSRSAPAGGGRLVVARQDRALVRRPRPRRAARRKGRRAVVRGVPRRLPRVPVRRREAPQKDDRRLDDALAPLNVSSGRLTTAVSRPCPRPTAGGHPSDGLFRLPSGSTMPSRPPGLSSARHRSRTAVRSVGFSCPARSRTVQDGQPPLNGALAVLAHPRQRLVGQHPVRTIALPGPRADRRVERPARLLGLADDLVVRPRSSRTAGWRSPRRSGPETCRSRPPAHRGSGCRRARRRA